MAKQKFELSADIVSTELKKNTPSIKEEGSTKTLPTKETRQSITLSTRPGFKSEFKAWCARKDMSMSDALEKGFELLRHKHGD